MMTFNGTHNFLFYRTAEQPSERTAEQPAERPDERPAERPAARPASGMVVAGCHNKIILAKNLL